MSAQPAHSFARKEPDTYLLLEGVIPNLLARLFELDHHPVLRRLYQGTRFEPLAHVGPLLIRATGNDALLQVFEEEWQAEDGALLEAEGSFDEVFEHLQSLIHARFDGGTVQLFRFHDPRLFGLWLGTLSDVERDETMGPIARIALGPLADDRWIVRQQRPDALRRYTEAPWLQVSEEQHAGIRRASFDQRLIKHVQHYFPEVLARFDVAGRQRWAAECRERAARHGFTRAGEVVRWAGLMAGHGPDFPDPYHHPGSLLILANSELDAGQRLDALILELQQRFLQAAAEVTP